MSYRFRVATLYLIVFFLDLLNMFIANVAYPEIGREFHRTYGQLTWISHSYILGLTLVIPLSRWLAERYGSKQMIILSLLIFSVATCGVSLSHSFFQLIGWRFLQGVGGGIVIPIGQALTYALYQQHERVKLSSAIMLVALLAPALSPTLGGVLLQCSSWRWVFFISVPLAGFALVGSVGWLRRQPEQLTTERLDVVGLVSGSSALFLLLLGLIQLSERSTSWQGSVLLSVGVVMLYGYLLSARMHPKPLINLEVIKEPLFRTAMLVYLFIPGLFTGVNLLVIFYLQDQFKLSVTTIGSLMLPWALASFAAISLTRKAFASWGARRLLVIGSVAHALGMLLLNVIDDSSAIAMAVFAFILMGFGGSLSSSTAQSSAFLFIKPCALADASAIWNINRQLSFCFGIAAVNLLFTAIEHRGIPLVQTYHLCFTLIAATAVIPLCCGLRIDQRRLTSVLASEKK